MYFSHRLTWGCHFALRLHCLLAITLSRVTCMQVKRHTQYGGTISIKNGSHEAAPTAESLSLVSHLLMDGLIIGTFTHPYTSNNTFYMENKKT